jgi:hypothetical protein
MVDIFQLGMKPKLAQKMPALYGIFTAKAGSVSSATLANYVRCRPAQTFRLPPSFRH